MNIYSKAKDPRARILSNFAHTPFIISIWSEAHACASVEGLWQGLKHKGDMRQHVCELSGFAAKKKSKKCTCFDWGYKKGIQYGSRDHYAIIREAVVQKVLHNPRVAEALKSTLGVQLTHNVPSRSSKKPAFDIAKVLMDVRKELFE